MSGISCHVLDTARGRPAPGLRVRLERLTGAASWSLLAEVLTDDDGRASGLEGGHARSIGLHRVTFETAEYFQRTAQAVFYPRVVVEFVVGSHDEKYHVPLLLSPFGYSTYRGS